jgi:hypothetical protein
VFSIRLPLWVYWSLAGAAVAAAAVFTIYFDFSSLGPVDERRMLFTLWGGPVTLVVAATLATWIKRGTRPRR